MDEKTQNELILEEIRGLKRSIAPMISFIEELKDLKIKNKIPLTSNIGSLSLLIADVRQQVMNDVFAANYSLKSSLSEVQELFTVNQRDVMDKFDYIHQNLLDFQTLDSQNKESVLSIKGQMAKFHDKMDAFRKDLDEKSSLEDISEIRKKIKLFAFQYDLEALKVEVSEKASRDSMNKLEKRLNRLEGFLDNFIHKSNLDEIEQNIRLKVEAFMDLNCVSRDDFSEFKAYYSMAKLKVDEDLKNLNNKFEVQTKNFRENNAKVQQKLSDKPWKKDNEKIRAEMLGYSKLADFKDFENKINPLIGSYEQKMTIFTSKINEFEIIVERYDEILLEKASKDDIKQIKSQLPTFVTLNNFDEGNKKLTIKTINLTKDLEDLNSTIKSHENTLSSLSNRIESLKKDSKETLNIISILNSVREQISEKADKIDFHKLLDIMGKKENIDKINDRIDCIQKQIELNAILSQTLCRTLIAAGESSSVVVRQRQDVYRKMTGLVGWISGEEPRVKSTVPWRGTPLVKPELYLFREDSLKHLPKSARNNTATIRMRPKRYTPRPMFSSLDLLPFVAGSL